MRDENATSGKGWIPKPFEDMNKPILECSVCNNHAEMALSLPTGAMEFDADSVVRAIIDLLNLRTLPTNVDWLVVGAMDESGNRNITTIGENEDELQHQIITRVLDTIDEGWEIPVGWQEVLMPKPIASIFISAVQLRNTGERECRTVSAMRVPSERLDHVQVTPARGPH